VKEFFPGVPMSLRRLGWVAAIAVATVIEISCGQVYRPVVIPINNTPPNSGNFHAVFGISANVPFNPGTALQIDVSGDTNIGVANMGVNPMHAAVLPSGSRVVVASAGSLYTGEADLVSIFSEAPDSQIGTGLGTPSTISFPYGSLPVFVNTTENTALYVANFGTNSVSAVNTSAVIRLTAPVGNHPVALAETPDARNLYVVNEGDNTVMDLFPTDLSTLALIPVGNSPVWAVTRVDGQRVYVITQGDGQLYTINTTTNAVSGQPLGGPGANFPGANFVVYDKSRNRVYVTNPGTGAAAGGVYVYDATSDPPRPLGSSVGLVNIPPPPPCAVVPSPCGPVMPVSVAALPDGTRFYVASYATATGACPDPSVTAAGCIIPQVTVFDALSLSVKTTVFPLLLPFQDSSNQTVQPFAMAPVAFCAPVIPYNPNNLVTRFRMSAAAAADSTRVYASLCDAGAIAIVNTTTSTLSSGGSNTPDTFVIDLFAPFSAGPPQANGEPLPQSPVFLITGQ
jgi:DNA-binding beta-propeller fold protein YncE